MKQNYLLPVIQRKLDLEGKFVSGRVRSNPRITEINNTTTQYVRRMGNLFMYDPLSIIYDIKFNQMMNYFLQDASYIETDQYGALQVNLPEYRDAEHDIAKKEYLRYEVDEEGRMSRTRKRRVRYVRLAGKPHIVQIIDLDTGKERYIDIRDSEHFEDLDLSNAVQVEKEEIADLTQIEKIRITERTSNSVYGEGIKTLLGMQINLDQVSPDER